MSIVQRVAKQVHAPELRGRLRRAGVVVAGRENQERCDEKGGSEE
jgi:hypothetical protein